MKLSNIDIFEFIVGFGMNWYWYKEVVGVVIKFRVVKNVVVIKGIKSNKEINSIRWIIKFLEYL